MKRQRIYFSWKDPQAAQQYYSGISLHSHTMHSRESLGIIETYKRRSAAIAHIIATIEKRYSRAAGGRLDLSRAYFTPPLSASGAYLVEANQIQNELNLAPMVSLTDHDTIAAPRLLRLFLNPDTVPISMEWTVPFGASYFHIGIHNIPPRAVDRLATILGSILCSQCASSGSLCNSTHGEKCSVDSRPALSELAAFPDLLLVFNHPLWDVSGLGAARHLQLVESFLGHTKSLIHAIEVNALRTWRENLDCMKLAEAWNLPIISGGDRHGREPNAFLNLSRSESFSEFVQEIREENSSAILVMPQYRHPLPMRKIRTVWDVLRDQELQPGVIQRWPERIYLPWADGRLLPLSAAAWSDGTAAYEAVEHP